MTMLVSAVRGFLPSASRAGKKVAGRRHQQHMTFSTPPEPAGCGRGLPADAETWRRCRLLEGGLPAPLASEVAGDGRFDLHAVLELVDRGCPPELAVRILAPLSEEVTL